ARAFDWDVWRDCQETFDDIAIPWGVTTLEPGAFAHILETIVFLPDTVVHFSDENLLYERQWSCYYCSYNAAVKEPLNCDYRRTDEEFDIWYTPYGISEDDLDNWISRNGKLYYLHKDDVEWKWSGICHKMATGWQKIDGFFYFFDETGALQHASLPAGEYDLAGMKLHVDEEGAVSVSGWQQNRIDCFYYDKGELVQDSWQEIDGSRFYFDEAGVLQQADLPAGNYTFGEASFTVDEEGRVTPSP
ncbi:MAG: hypothetical protein PUC47_04010, partial [Oscillospiraceae bacterium]|nr:hypothetical protein [Oscillospiraceae bacterium]